MSATNAHETTPAPPQSASAANPTSPGPEQKQAQGGEPEEKKATTTPPQPEDEMRALLQNMTRVAGTLSPREAGLQSYIANLALSAAADPGRLQQASFRTGVAYAVQDLEKATGQALLSEGPLAAEMQQRATTMPGLSFGPMRDLLQETPTLSDPTLVSDIRHTARNVANLGS
jgi:hypothetical protein